MDWCGYRKHLHYCILHIQFVNKSINYYCQHKSICVLLFIFFTFQDIFQSEIIMFSFYSPYSTTILVPVSQGKQTIKANFIFEEYSKKWLINLSKIVSLHCGIMTQFFSFFFIQLVLMSIKSFSL
jgi:hypothetical protein